MCDFSETFYAAPWGLHDADLGGIGHGGERRDSAGRLEGSGHFSCSVS